MLMAALVAAVMPLSTIRAEEMADTTVIEKITLNGKPATPQQKAVAKKMAKQGAQMAAKGLKMAAAAVSAARKSSRKLIRKVLPKAAIFFPVFLNFSVILSAFIVCPCKSA